eukprot:jgi/Chlat1/1907/Chrsp149S00116
MLGYVFRQGTPRATTVESAQVAAEVGDGLCGGEPVVVTDKDVPRNPVVLVPGIGGSVLNVRDNAGKAADERVWVRLWEADREFQRKLWSKFNPDTSEVESIDSTSHVVVPDDRFGLAAIDILDPDLRLRVDDLYYFRDIITLLTAWGYVEGTTLFGFGFDFRQSNRLERHMEAFKERLKLAYDSAGGRKVDVISHSMGGLLLKCFMALRPQEFQQYVGTWVAITAPFQGAPGYIVDALLTGVQFTDGWKRELFVSKWTVHQLVVEMPSIHEMRASPFFEWNELPTLNVWRQPVGDNAVAVLESYPPTSLDAVLTEALKGNSVKVDKQTVPLPLNPKLVDWANETQRILKDVQLPEGVDFYNIYGVGYPTPFHVCYGSEKTPLKEASDMLTQAATYVNHDGDGTVPAESARADGLEAIQRFPVVAEHRGVLRSPETFAILRQVLHVPEDAPSLIPALPPGVCEAMRLASGIAAVAYSNATHAAKAN